MLKISVKIEGMDRTLRWLSAGQKQARYSAAVALTRTAKDLERKLADDMRSAFSSASPYTLRSQYVSPATRDKLRAEVGIKDKAPARGTAPAKLVREHFIGGQRGSKPMEVALRARGALPAGHIVVPGAGMKLDRYGNPSKAAVTEILGALKSGIAVYAGRGKRAAAVVYFVAPVGGNRRTAHLAPGIYKRTQRGSDSAIQPMLLFVKAAPYRRVIFLDRIARTAQPTFSRHFDAALAQAMATAR